MVKEAIVRKVGSSVAVAIVDLFSWEILAAETGKMPTIAPRAQSW